MDPHDLYGLPLEQFISQRNALARELRRAGERDQAAAVSKLRKPSVAAWAVNQLVRTQQRDVADLFEAGDALQQAQEEVLARRGDAASLRQRMEAERAVTRQLADKARGLLNGDGHELTAARIEQVSETLHAAALDPAARTAVQGGCLERELRHVGLGGLGALTGAAPAGQQRERRSDARARLKAAREAEAHSRRELAEAARRLRIAEQQHERATAQLSAADETLASARELAAAAEERQREAKQRLNELKPREG